MLTANLGNIRVYAEECHDRKVDYRCPECGEKVILAKGSVKIPHFKHEAHTACEYSGETMEHLRVKAWLYRNLKRRPDIEVVEAECSRFKGIRPDVAFKLQGKWVGFEIQRSGISKEEIIDRCEKYARNNVYILWVATEKLYKKIYDTKNDIIPEVKLSQQARLFYKLHDAIVMFTGHSLMAFTFRNAAREREAYNYYEGYTGETYWEELKTVFVPRYCCRVYITDFKIKEYGYFKTHSPYEEVNWLANVIKISPENGWDDFEYFDEFYGDSA